MTVLGPGPPVLQTGLGLDLAGVRAALDRISTTDDEDLAQLREASCDTSSRFAATAIRFRIAKKKSLRQALQQLATA